MRHSIPSPNSQTKYDVFGSMKQNMSMLLLLQFDWIQDTYHFVYTKSSTLSMPSSSRDCTDVYLQISLNTHPHVFLVITHSIVIVYGPKVQCQHQYRNRCENRDNNIFCNGQHDVFARMRNLMGG